MTTNEVIILVLFFIIVMYVCMCENTSRMGGGLSGGGNMKKFRIDAHGGISVNDRKWVVKQLPPNFLIITQCRLSGGEGCNKEFANTFNNLTNLNDLLPFIGHKYNFCITSGNMGPTQLESIGIQTVYGLQYYLDIHYSRRNDTEPLGYLWTMPLSEHKYLRDPLFQGSLINKAITKGVYAPHHRLTPHQYNANALDINGMYLSEVVERLNTQYPNDFKIILSYSCRHGQIEDRLFLVDRTTVTLVDYLQNGIYEEDMNIFKDGSRASTDDHLLSQLSNELNSLERTIRILIFAEGGEWDEDREISFQTTVDDLEEKFTHEFNTLRISVPELGDIKDTEFIVHTRSRSSAKIYFDSVIMGIIKYYNRNHPTHGDLQVAAYIKKVEKIKNINNI